MSTKRHFPLARFSLAWAVAAGAVAFIACRSAAIETKPAISSETPHSAQATLRIHAGRRAPYAIPRLITGKFCEHLGSNIYNGMDAQILRNPTFADIPFLSGQSSPDGVATFQSDPVKIVAELRSRAARLGWPQAEVERLVESRNDGLACWWTREGARKAIRVSPDAGPSGGRAQRIETSGAGEGIAQWAYLPLHRVRQYEFELFARSPTETGLVVSLYAFGAEKPLARATVKGLSREWQTVRGTLTVEPASPADAIYRLAITANGAGQIVLSRCLLQPADHVAGADPDVVRLLKESRLPILRWPGGNFVSGYHWEDGIGPAERRLTRPNHPWGGVETNLFGTDEFMALCRAVGCEPMICVNAGNGAPDEAARWVEYCNGPKDSPMGARRAANGHPEPYNVRHWEIGNELWGRHQIHWTTAAGYMDRYREFARAMRAADPTIRLYACGAPVMWGKDWNDTLISGLGPALAATTDHPLVGGQVAPTADPLDVYRDFMAVPDVLQEKWADLERQMKKAGIREPRLAVTELQMFARVARSGDTGTVARLTSRTLVSPPTLAEAIYDTLIYHAAVRLGPFVEMVTHSATVNHGGGLRKERERVYANPCHYAQAMFAELAGATPVETTLESPTERAPVVLPELKSATSECQFRAMDAVVALQTDGDLLLSIVHRGAGGPIRLSVNLEDFKAAPRAEIRALSADVPWAANTLEQPEAIRPKDSTIAVQGNHLALEIPPFTVMRIHIPSAR